LEGAVSSPWIDNKVMYFSSENYTYAIE
jgi:hypothetical protein